MKYLRFSFFFFFFFNDTATTEIYTLSLHDALPISAIRRGKTASLEFPIFSGKGSCSTKRRSRLLVSGPKVSRRSEEHTSELQSRLHLVCRLLLEKKKQALTDISLCQRTYILPIRLC